MSPSGNKQAWPYFCKEYQSLHARTLQKVSGAFQSYFALSKQEFIWMLSSKCRKFRENGREKKKSFQKQEGLINPAVKAFGNQSYLCDPA
jgi:hypothetical protein